MSSETVFKNMQTKKEKNTAFIVWLFGITMMRINIMIMIKSMIDSPDLK